MQPLNTATSTTSTRIRWSPRVPPHKIRRLYESDARGLLDTELLDDVGYSIYIRCQEDIELAEAQKGRVKCRNCGNIIVRQTVNGQFSREPGEVLKCPTCSWQITCRDYHESLLRIEPPPPYEAEYVFRSFVQKWPVAPSSREKLLLIDALIHAFHMHYRAVGTPLGCSVIKATAGQLAELLEGLAYGPESTQGVQETRQEWFGRLKARQMQHSKSDLQAIARELGIKGYSRMVRLELVKAIERVDPSRFEAWRNLVQDVNQVSERATDDQVDKGGT